MSASVCRLGPFLSFYCVFLGFALAPPRGPSVPHHVTHFSVTPVLSPSLHVFFLLCLELILDGFSDGVGNPPTSDLNNQNIFGRLTRRSEAGGSKVG